MPIGSPDFVTAFVKSKTAAMVDDVRKLQVLSNGLTHFRLVKFCHNTRRTHMACILESERAHVCLFISVFRKGRVQAAVVITIGQGV